MVGISITKSDISLPKVYVYGLFVSIIFGLAFWLANFALDSRLTVEALRIGIIAYLLVIIPVLKSKIKWSSALMLFTFTFILFFLSRVIGSFYDDNYLFASDKYVFYQFSNTTVSTILMWMGISIASIYSGFFVSYIFFRPNQKHVSFTNQYTVSLGKRMNKIVWMAVIITIPGMLYKSAFDLYIIFKYGYAILYVEVPEIAPAWARISWGAFKIIFPCLLVFCNSKKDFRKIVIFFFAVSLISFIKGTRGELIIPIVFFIWFYYAKFSDRDLSIKKILIFLVFVSVTASVMLLTRGAEFNLNFMDIFLALFMTQGVQYVFMGNYIDYCDKFVVKTPFYIFFPIISTYEWFFNPVFRKGQSLDLVRQTISLDDQLTYAVNSEAYLEGSGYGSSYLPELYAFGGILGIIIGSGMLGFIINWFDSTFKRSPIFIIISWYWIAALIWMPRGSYIINPFMPLITILFFSLVKMIAKSYPQYMHYLNK